MHVRTRIANVLIPDLMPFDPQIRLSQIVSWVHHKTENSPCHAELCAAAGRVAQLWNSVQHAHCAMSPNHVRTNCIAHADTVQHCARACVLSHAPQARNAHAEGATHAAAYFFFWAAEKLRGDLCFCLLWNLCL